MREPLFEGRARAERRARAARLGAPYLVPIALVSLLAFLIWRNWGALSGFNLSIATAAPETQVKEALAHQDRASLEEVYGFHAGGTAELHPVRFADVTVEVEQGRARVLAVVEARGRVVWHAERADLSYVGREAFSMTPCTIALWCGDGQQFAGLRGVLSALFRRADAAAGRDLGAAGRLVSDAYAEPGGKPALLARLAEEFRAPPLEIHVRAWQIRVERDRAEVGEDYQVSGAGEGGRRRARYVLSREGERWRFVDGL
ncbi:MAG TPA: nuclear transport factor 2 family protein [Anaeromyxobacter sp.]|nr:nuclear transport factor 2 family protein [Anaeromyxobacter sp.]